MRYYLDLLNRKKAELERAIGGRDGITVVQTPDLLEDVQLSAARDLAIQTRDLEFHLLRQVRAAIQRIEDGSYGICMQCGKPIPPKRLEAVPWASCCVPCQEELEEGHTMSPPPPAYSRSLLAKAA